MSSHQAVDKAPWILSAIGVVAIIWNAMGGMNFVMQMNPDALAKMPETHRAIAEARPIWATAAFAVSVFGGGIGGALLLLRKSAALHVFAASFLAVLITMVHAIGMAGALSLFSGFEIVLAVIMPVLLAAIFVWYARFAKQKSWLE